MTGLIGALQFLTRIPISTRRAIPHARSVPWFPVAGLLIGSVIGGLATGLQELVPPTVAAAIAVVVGLVLTGAFHEDGLADIADAFGGGWTREQRFEILKDSRHGTYGVAALCASVVMRVVAAASLVAPGSVFAGFIAAHVLGRTAIIAALWSIRPATESGLGAEAAREMRRSTAAFAVAGGIAITALAVGWWVAVLVVTAVVATAATGWLAVRKIGGLAGDVLGAIEQVVECGVLVVVSGLALRSNVWWA